MADEIAANEDCPCAVYQDQSECLRELFGELSLHSLGYIVRGMHEQIKDINMLLHLLEERIGEMQNIIGPTSTPTSTSTSTPPQPEPEPPQPAPPAPPEPVSSSSSSSSSYAFNEQPTRALPPVPPTPPVTPRSILKNTEKKGPRFSEERSLSEGRAISNPSKVKTLRVKWDQFMSGKSM